ncbi:MAG: hypothetical protein ACT4NX_03490 [Deltaproteobacteria bacterium]
MKKNFGFYFNRKNIPLSLYPVIILAAILFGALAVLGLFVGAVVGAVGIGYLVVRSLFSPKGRGAGRVDSDGKTIILRQNEYEVVDKKK